MKDLKENWAYLDAFLSEEVELFIADETTEEVFQKKCMHDSRWSENSNLENEPDYDDW